jgi:hypothetical protein
MTKDVLVTPRNRRQYHVVFIDLSIHRKREKARDIVERMPDRRNFRHSCGISIR